MQMCKLVWVYEWPSKISTKHTNFTLCLSPSNSKCHSPQITGEIFSIVSLSSVFTLSFSFAVFFIDNTVFDMFHSDFAQFEQAPTHLFASFIICCDIFDFHKINYSRELFSYSYSYSSSCCCCCCCWRWWYFLLLRFSFVQFFPFYSVARVWSVKTDERKHTHTLAHSLKDIQVDSGIHIWTFFQNHTHTHTPPHLQTGARTYIDVCINISEGSEMLSLWSSSLLLQCLYRLV